MYVFSTTIHKKGFLTGMWGRTPSGWIQRFLVPNFTLPPVMALSFGAFWHRGTFKGKARGWDSLCSMLLNKHCMHFILWHASFSY